MRLDDVIKIHPPIKMNGNPFLHESYMNLTILRKSYFSLQEHLLFLFIINYWQKYDFLFSPAMLTLAQRPPLPPLDVITRIE